MGWSQSQIDALAAAVATGVLEVRFDGPPARLVRYQSLSEMRDLLREMQATGASDVPVSARPSAYRLIATRKGLGS